MQLTLPTAAKGSTPRSLDLCEPHASELLRYLSEPSLGIGVLEQRAARAEQALQTASIRLQSLELEREANLQRQTEPPQEWTPRALLGSATETSELEPELEHEHDPDPLRLRGSGLPMFESGPSPVIYPETEAPQQASGPLSFTHGEAS